MCLCVLLFSIFWFFMFFKFFKVFQVFQSFPSFSIFWFFGFFFVETYLSKVAQTIQFFSKLNRFLKYTQGSNQRHHRRDEDLEFTRVT